ncbi:MAG TPA: M56 family metallopeptidase [Candidatus Eisenbacteria bacterium]|nr:M56 family metallopeptidase [Candidatus Eisenbacteria bacterium]
MLAIAAALALAGLLASPHLMRQSRLAPADGIVLWSAVLGLRAAVAVCLVIVFVLFMPATQLFTLLTHWCFHAVIPFFATHLGFDGHSLGGAAILVPALVMAASLLSVGFGAWRGARAVRRWLRGSVLGPGPEHSVIVGGSEVIVAAAGLRAPQVVVSAGALLNLDDAELRAGLQHEWGHVTRRHRYISLFGQGCRAMSRFLPGGTAALDALQLDLERDADDYAVRRTGDPLALASAICKAATAQVESHGPAFARLGGSGVPERLRLLAHGGRPSISRTGTRLARSTAAMMAVLALGLAAATPTLASSGLDELTKVAVHHDSGCE